MTGGDLVMTLVSTTAAAALVGVETVPNERVRSRTVPAATMPGIATAPEPPRARACTGPSSAAMDAAGWFSLGPLAFEPNAAASEIPFASAGFDEDGMGTAAGEAGTGLVKDVAGDALNGGRTGGSSTRADDSSGVGAEVDLTGSATVHRFATLAATGESVGARLFMRSASELPRGLAGSSDSGPQRAFFARISCSSLSVSSRSASVMPWFTRCSGGGLAPPPMNDASDAPSRAAPPPASLVMFSRALAMSRGSSVSIAEVVKVRESRGAERPGGGSRATELAASSRAAGATEMDCVRELWRLARAWRARYTSCGRGDGRESTTSD